MNENHDTTDPRSPVNSKRDLKKKKFRPIIFKLLETKTTKIFEDSRYLKNIMYRGRKTKLRANVPSETQAKRQCHSSGEKKNLSTQNPISSKNITPKGRKINTFQEKKKLRKLVAGTPTLQKIVKVLQAEIIHWTEN